MRSQASNALERVLADVRLAGAQVSACVSSLDGKLLFEHNDSARLMPASNQKLLTASFAIYELGPQYRPTTRFWLQSDMLTVDAPGDPMLTYKDLVSVREQLGGRVELVKVHQGYAPGIPDSWEFDDLPNKYAAQVTALTFDRGAFEARVHRGQILLLPEPFGVSIARVPGPTTSIRYEPMQRKLTLFGPITAMGQIIDTLALPDPARCAALVFGRRYVATATVPTVAPTLSFQGKSTAEVVAACLPPSDNNLAEHLFLQAANHLGPVADRPYLLARERMTKFLTRVVGVSPLDLRVFDGSGMSRHNLVTTRALCRLLSWHANQPDFPAWRSYLAVPGVGTLRNRLASRRFAGKTGSLDMVAALSGYITTQDSKDLVVSVILNNYGCSESDARSIIDSFIDTVSVARL